MPCNDGDKGGLIPNSGQGSTSRNWSRCFRLTLLLVQELSMAGGRVRLREETLFILYMVPGEVFHKPSTPGSEKQENLDTKVCINLLD